MNLDELWKQRDELTEKINELKIQSAYLHAQRRVLNRTIKEYTDPQVKALRHGVKLKDNEGYTPNSELKLKDDGEPCS